MNPNYRAALLFVLLCAVALSTAARAEAALESFDNGASTRQGDKIVSHPLTYLVDGAGVEGSGALKVDYVGYERGSKRVVVHPQIPPARAYELAFSVRFCEGFDFARGGKLHGLGPDKPVTGGQPVHPEGWSARLMFRGGGKLTTYIYHQDQKGRFGDTRQARNLRFRPGRYYELAMRVTLNEPVNQANGRVEVYVDGARIIDHKGLRFRAVDTQSSLVSRLLFNTFHGGSNPTWAPRDASGAYKTDCAYFDDVSWRVVE
ncbi:polysaccharide lyase [Marinobacter bryozoorum]|uniref:polysaccharide lyase n=1 Tax=Marinobacter bryozoorum TaxID=256324 RepID=UPI002004062F|nr:polysaccharide lyase [Marinobacter bryozoorum]MCK7546064.1 polysaccharide lyase [Marinobacter bryozoorum]